MYRLLVYFYIFLTHVHVLTSILVPLSVTCLNKEFDVINKGFDVIYLVSFYFENFST